MSEFPISKDGNVWRPETGLTKGLSTKAVHPSSTSLQNEYDVIVIGGGFAGLTAAREIGSRAKTLLIEARDRIGGRTWTANLDDQEVEMGGMWVHWYVQVTDIHISLGLMTRIRNRYQTFIWGELMRYELYKNTITASGTVAPEKAYWRQNDKLKVLETDEFTNRVDSLLAKFFNVDGLNLKDVVDRPYDTFHRREIFEKYDKVTAQQRIDEMGLEENDSILLATFISNYGLDRADQIGFGECFKWFALTGITSEGVNDTMGMYKLKNGGTTSLANAIFEEYDGDRLFDAPIRKVTQTAEGVTVETHGGKSFKSKYIICTIPLNVLKDIEFSPPLSPLRTEAVKKGHPGRGGKILYTVSPPERPFLSSAAIPAELTFLFTTHESNNGEVAHLVSFVHSDSKMRDFSDSEKVKQAYKDMVPETSTSEIVRYAYHDWRNDPYAQGTWCCFEAEYSTKYLEELQSKHGERVIMASSDYADGWRGCIDGAIEQGIRSAMVVKKLLKQ